MHEDVKGKFCICLYIARIERGEVSNRGGKQVEKKMDGGLVREDEKYLYRIEDEIPIMLIDEAVPLEGVEVSAEN